MWAFCQDSQSDSVTHCSSHRILMPGAGNSGGFQEPIQEPVLFFVMDFPPLSLPLILPPCSFRPLGIIRYPSRHKVQPPNQFLPTRLLTIILVRFYTQQQRKSVLNDDRWLFLGGSTLYKDFIFFTTSPSSPFPFPHTTLKQTVPSLFFFYLLLSPLLSSTPPTICRLVLSNNPPPTATTF